VPEAADFLPQPHGSPVGAVAAGPPSPPKVALVSLALVAEIRDGELLLTTADGTFLDPVAAQVLLALGGAVPPWLPAVEGLQAVWNELRSIPALLSAAAALGHSRDLQDRFARTSPDPAVLIGLAAAGIAAVAQNPQCSAVSWDFLRLHPDESVCEEALDLAEVLPAALCRHPDADTRARAARNLACTRQDLSQLSRDPSVAVRLSVAGNPHSSSRSLRRVARLKSVAIRAAAAGNRNFPVHSYRAEMLLTDRSGLVLAAFASRTDVTGHFLHRVNNLARTRCREYARVAYALKRNPNTPKRLRRSVEARLQPAQPRGLRQRATLTSLLALAAVIVVLLSPARHWPGLILFLAVICVRGLRAAFRSSKR